MEEVIRKILFIILFILIASCGKDSSTLKTPNLVSHRELVISVDYEFNQEQEKQIAEALSEWSQASDGTLHFKILWNQPKPGLYKYYSYPKHGIFVWYINKEDPTLTDELKEKFEKVDGLHVPGKNKSANIIIFHQTPNFHFKAVILHEFGHLIGLEHIAKEGHVMSFDAGSDCLTLDDTKQLCNYYNCFAKSMCLSCNIFDDNLLITSVHTQ